MNVDSSKCASSDPTQAWEQLDWTQCERQASRLQARIVKATRAGRWGKVKALQRLLMRWSSGAVRAARPLAGKPGVEMGFDGHGLQCLAHVRALHYVAQDFAGLGFHEIAGPPQLRGPLKFHRHGQGRLAVGAFGGTQLPPAIRGQE